MVTLEDGRVIDGKDYVSEDIKTIGQGFADQIFRVYKNKNPDIQIIPINTNKEVDFMIKRSQK